MAEGGKITLAKYIGEELEPNYAPLPGEGKGTIFIYQPTSSARPLLTFRTGHESETEEWHYNALARIEDLVTLENRVQVLEDSEDTTIVKSGIDGDLTEMGDVDLYLQANANALENIYEVTKPALGGPYDWNPTAGVLLGLFSKLTSLVSRTLTLTTSIITSLEDGFNVYVVPAGSSPLVRTVSVNINSEFTSNFLTIFVVRPEAAGEPFVLSFTNGTIANGGVTVTGNTDTQMVALFRVWDSTLGKSVYFAMNLGTINLYTSNWL